MDRSAAIQSVCGAPGEDRREAVLCNALLASVRSNRPTRGTGNGVGGGVGGDSKTNTPI